MSKLTHKQIEVVYRYKKLGGQLFYGVNNSSPVAFSIVENYEYIKDDFAGVSMKDFENIELLYFVNQQMYNCIEILNLLHN